MPTRWASTEPASGSASGWYVDGIAQVRWYEDVKAQSPRVAGPASPISLSTKGRGWAASLEGGNPIQIGGGWIAEPQAKLTHQRINLDDSADVAAIVRFQITSLAGRVGARFARTWALDEGDKPWLMTAWLRVNLWHEFMGDNKTEFSSAAGFLPFGSDLGGSWVELAAGFSAQLKRRATAYSQVSYMRGASDRHAVSGRLGVRLNWEAATSDGRGGARRDSSRRRRRCGNRIPSGADGRVCVHALF